MAKLTPGWYWAIRYMDGRLECVLVKSKLIGGGMELVVESVGYDSSLPVDRYEFFGRVELPEQECVGVRHSFQSKADLAITSFRGEPSG